MIKISNCSIITELIDEMIKARAMSEQTLKPHNSEDLISQLKVQVENLATKIFWYIGDIEFQSDMEIIHDQAKAHTNGHSH